jgi:hypothetical protein
MRSRYGRTVAAIVALVVSATLRPQAQTPAPAGAAPFDIIGFIDAATVDTATDTFSGGTITVNGTNIIVPRNTLLQMPAFALTWQEVFAMAPGPYGIGSGPNGAAQSGLAKADTPTPYTTYEVRIQGNRIGSGTSEKYIAGLMFISQQSENAGAGFINAIDAATGEIRVGGTIGDATTGARVIINDPHGKFAPVRTDDPRFTIDEDNPTVRSETGYPMCVAHGDDTCPESNRPKNADGTYSTSFTMDATPDWAFMVPAGTPSNGTNPLMMAPFEVGDYVTYNGNLSHDAKGDFILAHTVTANVGIFTQPGTQPTYVAIDTMLLGVGGAPDPNLPQEAAVRTRIEGFTTDPSSFVMLSAIDVDPCTGQETERWYDMVQVDPGPLVGVPGRGIGAVAGRWRWRPNSDAFVLPPSRMLRATSINGAYFDWTSGSDTTPSGIKAGYYSAPNFEFIFPENLGIGNPPVPSNFQDFPFLANGSGPYTSVVVGTVAGTLGQLNPWPGAVAPVPPTCSADGTTVFTPIADAGPNQQAKRGDTVTLNGAGSKDTTTPSPLPLNYTWWQVGADLKPLAASDPTRLALPAGTTPFGTTQDLPTMTFTLDKFLNGNSVDNVTLTFRLDVSNCQPWSWEGSCATSSATMTVTVVKNPTPSDTLTGVSAIWRARRSRLDVNATTSDPSAVLTVLGFGDMGPALPIATGVPAPPGDRSYTQVGVNPAPTEITVRSSLGAIVTVPITVRP